MKREYVSTNQGFCARLAEYEQLNADQFMETMWQGYRNQLIGGGREPGEAAQVASNTLISDYLLYNIYNKPDDGLFDSNGKLTPGTTILPGYAGDLDWYKPIERKGYRQEYNISGDGATEKNNYFFPVGYLNEKGYVLTRISTD